MDGENYRTILSRAGKVLVAIGIADVGAMIYCILNQINYSSSFNVFAIIAGFFLWRGSLRAASIVTFLSALYLSTMLCLILGTLLIEPTSLTFAFLRLHPHFFMVLSFMNVVVLALLSWLLAALTMPSVLDARRLNGAKLLSLRIPVICGAATTCLVMWLGAGMNDGETSQHAKALAAQKLGDGYEYYVSNLKKRSNGENTSVDATVTAWNETNIRQVTVQWDQQ